MKTKKASKKTAKKRAKRTYVKRPDRAIDKIGYGGPFANGTKFYMCPATRQIVTATGYTVYHPQEPSESECVGEIDHSKLKPGYFEAHNSITGATCAVFAFCSGYGGGTICMVYSPHARSGGQFEWSRVANRPELHVTRPLEDHEVPETISVTALF